MQKRNLSTYKITHEGGRSEEVINAASVLEAVSNLEISEKESPITAVIRTKQANVPSLCPDVPAEVIIQVYVDPEQTGTGCVATPASATMHAGDSLVLEAFPSKGYKFAGWKIDGEIVSMQAKYEYTVPEPEVPGIVMNILAEFALADVAYTVTVDPPEATSAGCAAGPSATVEANTEVELYAVTGETYKFDGWYLREEELSKNPVLTATVDPLKEDELKREYVAKYSLLP